jgi:hypothetical protein
VTGRHRHLIKKAGVGELTSKVTATDNPYRSPVRCRDHLGVVVRHIAVHDVYVRTRSRQLPGWCAEGVVIVHHPAQPRVIRPRSAAAVDRRFPRRRSRPTTSTADWTSATPSAS